VNKTILMPCLTAILVAAGVTGLTNSNVLAQAAGGTAAGGQATGPAAGGTSSGGTATGPAAGGTAAGGKATGSAAGARTAVAAAKRRAAMMKKCRTVRNPFKKKSCLAKLKRKPGNIKKLTAARKKAAAAHKIKNDRRTETLQSR
jgi:hypothetical protein